MNMDAKIYKRALVERTADLIARYPQLADDDAGGDAEARSAVIKIQQRLVKRGTPPIDALEEAAELWDKRRLLELAGWIVGDRDPRLNRSYAGKIMVAEPYDEEELPTDDGSKGPWCVVGDDLDELIRLAYEVHLA